MKSSDVVIFMVDDDEVDVMGVQRALKRANLDNPLIVASDGREALEKLRMKDVDKPFMMLLDLNMPRMDGIEFLRAAREDTHLKDAVVFMLTTSASEDDKNRAYQFNVAGYVVKDRSGGGFVNVAELVRQYTTNVQFPT